MASFLESSLRLMFKRKPRQGAMKSDTEKPAGVDTSARLSSTLGANSAVHLHPRSFENGGDHHQSFVIPTEDSLSLFRLMLGITDAPRLGFAQNGPFGTRPASNIGIYARVVHSEQKSKDSFKVSHHLRHHNSLTCHFLNHISLRILAVTSSLHMLMRRLNRYSPP